ncbi:MAG: 1-(5-phosphoribosyl)-5-[Lachnospiraceae bacterium]|nr:1-(5-phosphoribosyl)-5-[(5-phosphoribosylamino)methylideneamino]imidazole-4-carboxamide isomerase [Lachnospiraceae bacterium]
MIILPAIDLYDKKAVRLYKGDYKQMTVYDENPIHTARLFESAGAGWIHMVDLEGAKDGTTPNMDIVRQIANETSLKVEIGGGIRSMEIIEKYMEAGVSRVILGTIAVTDPSFVDRAVAAYGSKIAVGADARDGFIATHGWMENSGISLMDFCHEMENKGVSTIICTDISKDGAMQGTNRGLYRTLQSELSVDIVASGGVSSMEDVSALAETGIYGAIIGKAYYTGAIDLAEAVRIAAGRASS